MEDWEIHWKDYYKILQVDPAAEPEVVKGAYDRLAKKYHPDTNKDTHANERMKEINAAYEVLGNPENRTRYDSAWHQRQGKGAYDAGTLIPPKPVAEPSQIQFSDVEPGEIKKASFTIRNLGGPYDKIWVDRNPDSWVKVTNWHSLTASDELPLEVEIEAIGADWGKSYSEYIRVKLDEEETGVRVELSTKPAPDKSRSPAGSAWAQTSFGASSSSGTAPIGSPVLRPKFPSWAKWILGLACISIIIAVVISKVNSTNIANPVQPTSGISSRPTSSNTNPATATNPSARSPSQTLTPASTPLPVPSMGPVANDVPGTTLIINSSWASLVDKQTKPKDVYAVTLTAGQQVQFAISGNPGSALHFRLANPGSGSFAKNSLTFAYDSWADSGWTYKFIPSVSGTYYVAVEAQSSGQSYTLSIIATGQAP